LDFYDGVYGYACQPTLYYCYYYEQNCWSGMYSYEGYCLDFCEYGYDEVTYTCNETEIWDMFTETPFKCIDPFWCSMTAPGSDPEVWVPYEDETGRRPDWRVGYFEVSQEMYAPCLSWGRFVEEYNNLKLFAGQTLDVLTGT